MEKKAYIDLSVEESDRETSSEGYRTSGGLESDESNRLNVKGRIAILAMFFRNTIYVY